MGEEERSEPGNSQNTDMVSSNDCYKIGCHDEAVKLSVYIKDENKTLV